jgi:ISXO2-like transposase domain
VRVAVAGSTIKKLASGQVKERAHAHKRVKTLASRMLDRQTLVLTDGLKCFRGVADAGSMHLPIRTGSGRQAARHPAVKWANTVLGNIKNSLTATYRGIAESTCPAISPSSNIASIGASI